MYRAERVEILVEEPSMQVFLRGLLPIVLPEGFALDFNCFIRPHQAQIPKPQSFRTRQDFGTLTR